MTRCAWATIAFASAVVLRAAPVGAQDFQARLAKAVAGPPPSVGMATPQVIVEAGEKNKQAQLVIGVSNSQTLTIAAPTSDGAKPTDFVSLSGLADQLSVSWRYSWLNWGLRDPAVMAPARDLVCRRYGLKVKGCTTLRLEHFLRANKRADEVPAADAAMDSASFKRWTWHVGVVVSGGWKEFKFFNPAAQADSIGRISRSAGISLSGVWGSGALVIGWSQEWAYKDRSISAQRCTALQSDTTLSRCVQLPVGKPADPPGVGVPIVRVGVRQILTSSIGWGPTLSLKFPATSIDVPVYFLAVGGQLTAGARLSWISTQKHLGFSVFLSKPLSPW